MLARMLVTKNHLVTTKPLGEKKVQLVRTKFSWREKSAVGETKVQLARKKCSWRDQSAVGEKHTLETYKRDWKHAETKNAIDMT